MTRNAILESVVQYYSGRLARHGASASGVDWNSLESRQVRFSQLLKIHQGEPSFSLNDYGYGYGALYDYLQRGGYDCSYRGFDVSRAMVGRAEELHPSGPSHGFTCNETSLEPADYSVASGIFNVKLECAADSWELYMLDTIERLARLSRRGFAFNVLSTYSDVERRRDDLYYADPCRLFDHCKRRYSDRVALLHDYGLYEFTILVRQGRTSG